MAAVLRPADEAPMSMLCNALSAAVHLSCKLSIIIAGPLSILIAQQLPHGACSQLRTQQCLRIATADNRF